MGEIADAVSAILAVAPVVAERFFADREEPGDAVDEELPVLTLIRVGVAVEGSLPSLDQAAARRLFEVVEGQLAAGSETVRTAVATGLLEHLAEALSAGRLDPGLLGSLLGPQSRAYLDAWDAFTLGRSSLDPPELAPSRQRRGARRWWRRQRGERRG